MISFKQYYDTGSGRISRFSKKFSTKKATELAKSFKGKVRLFEDYYKGWYLIPLKQNLREGTALITANLLLSFCEVIEQFIQGKKSTSSKTNKFVKSSLLRLYEKRLYQNHLHKNVNRIIVSSLVNKIYQILRNGLHHDLSTRGVHIFISRGVATAYSQDQSGEITELWFNPLDFLNVIETDFRNYIKKLNKQSDTNLIKNFKTVFSKVFSI